MATAPVFQLVSQRTMAYTVILMTLFFTTAIVISSSFLPGGDGDGGDIFFERQAQRHGRHLGGQKQNDRSKADATIQLKKLFEEQFPPDDTDRVIEYVKSLRHDAEYKTQPHMPYDIYNCPPTPPIDYPIAWDAMDVINNWNPGNATEPNKIFQGICVFDYNKDFATALAYRKAEVPFLIRNTPTLLQTSERWNRDPEYLAKLLQGHLEKNEHSLNQHFMFWKVRHRQPKGWKPPTDEVQLNFEDWKKKAEKVTTNDPNQERWYFRLNGALEHGGFHEFLYNELDIFHPEKESFFMVDPSEQRGINCRFGMKGIIAETHYDQSRNFVVLMGGQRRYVLAHPRECPNLCLYPQNHPSGRHSAIDWTAPDLDKFPQFAQAQLNEVVLQAGDALYLPTYWFHFIVSLNTNYQCNARSGHTNENAGVIRECGFA